MTDCSRTRLSDQVLPELTTVEMLWVMVRDSVHRRLLLISVVMSWTATRTADRVLWALTDVERLWLTDLTA